MTDLRAIRRKMNYEAIDAENLRVARNTLDNLQKQVMLWDRPERAPLVSKEATLTIKGMVDNIIDILNNKIAVVNKLILERRGDLKDIMNNYDFINKYNQLIEPLITAGTDKSKQNAIETNLQLINTPVSELVILLKKLMNDNEFIDFSRIEGVFTAFSVYKNVENQLDKGNYYKITPERVKSMKADYIRDLNPEGIRLLDVAKQQSDLPPNQRLQAYIDEMGPISRGDMEKLKKIYGEPIEKLGKDLGKELKSTRQMFKDVMRSEGGLNRSQIDDLTDLLETQGTVSQTKMNELIRLYGENSAEMIRSIKESGNLNKDSIDRLAQTIADESNLTREELKAVLQIEGGLNRSQINELTDTLETQGRISQAKMDDLIRQYGESGAQMIKAIKDSGQITKDKIEELSKKLSTETKATASASMIEPIRNLVGFIPEEAKIMVEKKLYAPERNLVLNTILNQEADFLTGDQIATFKRIIGEDATYKLENLLTNPKINRDDFIDFVDSIPKKKK